jgi:hypothetical protein
MDIANIRALAHELKKYEKLAIELEQAQRDGLCPVIQE